MTQTGGNKDAFGKPRSFHVRPSSNMKKPRAQHQVLVEKAADTLAGAYHGFSILGAQGQRLEEKTAEAVYILVQELETAEELDEIINAVGDEKAREALSKAADKLLGRNQPAWYEDHGVITGLFLFGLMMCVMVGTMSS